MRQSPRNHEERNTAGLKYTKAAAYLPPWYNSDSSDSDNEAASNPESLEYWKDFQLPDWLDDKYPYGYEFLSNVLQGRSSFKSLECSEQTKLKICSEVCKIFRELDIVDTNVQIGSSKSSAAMEHMEKSLPGLSMLLLRADHALQSRKKESDNDKKISGSSTRGSKTFDVGSRNYWENVSFNEKIKKKHSKGLIFLERLLRKQASFNHFYGNRNEFIIVCKDLIYLYNILKIGEKLTCQGGRSVLASKVIEYIPGINNLLREADSFIENPNRAASNDVQSKTNGTDSIQNSARSETSDNDSSSEGNCDWAGNDEGNDEVEQTGCEESAVNMEQIGNKVSIIENNLDLSVSDLWTRPNAQNDIHRVINILCDRYVQRNKQANNKAFKSVKDLIFRYMCDYGLCILTAKASVMPKDCVANKEEASSKLPIAAAAIVDMVHEVESVDGKTKSHYALVVLLHTSINKFLLKLLQNVMRTKSHEVTHIYFSTLDHRKGPLLVYKAPVRSKVDEHHIFLSKLGCLMAKDAMLVNNYVYEPKTQCGTSTLIDFHKLVGNTIKNVRNNLTKMARKEKGWVDLGRTETHLVCTHYHYVSPHVIDSSECGYYMDKTGKRIRFVIPYNQYFGRSCFNIYGSDLGFPADYHAAFHCMDEADGSEDGLQRKRITHIRAGMSGSTNCCIWLSVLTMLNKYDPITSKKMQDMLAAEGHKFRHMWILRSRSKTEDTFDQVMRKCFGYYLKKRDESYLFKEDTEGMFICLLKEKDGNTVHAVAVEKSEQLLMYDFEDEYQFQPTRRLDNFHCVTNCKTCIGLQIVAEIIPPKKKSLLFPFNCCVLPDTIDK